MNTSKIISTLALGALLGCSDPALPPADAGGTDPGTTTEGATGATSTGSSTGSADGVDETASSSGNASDSGQEEDCLTPKPIPPPPVDCSGADFVVNTHVNIEGDGLGDDPVLLASVRRIEGSLRINGTSLTNLDFMACVQEVTGDITIFDNDQLTNVDGLWSLSSIGTDVIFSGNDALEIFDGLPNLERIPGSLVIRDNASLQSIRGFQSFVGLEGYTFTNEDGTEEFAGGNLTIQLNPVLEDIDGLGGLLVVNGVFAVTNNPELCCSSIACVGEGIVQPAEPPPSWGDTCGLRPNC
ncbi:receptor L domain-containing protein [Paraliomyxa miuraensis]|uniref:hypothetical protein n=1 Tax=Paraliomyxa miuraensis TaxID=376150 RepID=UPI002251A06B|nr:hypothetical protein [Paraliomyxa miuraensis]MCX4240819.1 hypothetical protein [Paraliomyxa miuraensis]